MPRSKRVDISCPHCNFCMNVKENSKVPFKTCPSCGKEFDLVSMKMSGEYDPRADRNTFPTGKPLDSGYISPMSLVPNATPETWKPDDTEEEKDEDQPEKDTDKDGDIQDT